MTTNEFKVEVIADNSGEWCSNGIPFATIEEAERYGRDLFSRWSAVREWRVVPHPQPTTTPPSTVTGGSEPE